MERFTTIDLLDKVTEFERRWPKQEEWGISAIDSVNLPKLLFCNTTRADFILAAILTI